MKHQTQIHEIARQMEEGEEVFIPEAIKVEVLNIMFHSLQRHKKLRTTYVVSVDHPDELNSSPIPPPSSSSSSLTPNHPMNSTMELSSLAMSGSSSMRPPPARSIEELLQRGDQMMESPIAMGRMPSKNVERVTNAEDLETLLLHQAINQAGYD